MRPRFHPRLVNNPLGDPGLYVPLAFDRRALLFDLGGIDPLSAREILRISHVFVTHTHMDHFCGLDHLLRLCLGRSKTLGLFGPEGFLANVEGKLAAYTWNLVSTYQESLQLVVTEVGPHERLQQTFDCRDGFRPQQPPRHLPAGGPLLEEPSLQVHTAILDHGIPCLGFSLQERFHINIIRRELDAMGLTTGPWLQVFKQALYAQAPPDRLIEAPCGDRPGRTRTYPLGALAARIAAITPGQKIAYVADVGFHEANARRIKALARDANHLFIEGAFLDEDRAIARQKNHLTAGQAGALAAQAGVKRMTVFHFSPRYEGRTQCLQEQAQRAFRETQARLSADRRQEPAPRQARPPATAKR